MRSVWRGCSAVLAAVPLVACSAFDGESGTGRAEVLADARLASIPADVAVADDAIWVAAAGDDGGLVELDAGSLDEVRHLPVEGGADAVAAGEHTVWALTGEAGNVTVFDRSAGEDDEGTTFDIEIDDSDLVDEQLFEALESSGDVSYANGLHGLRRMTPDGEVLAPRDPGDDDFGTHDDVDPDLLHAQLPMVVTPSAVWAVTEDGLGRFDPDTLAPIDEGAGSDDVTALAAHGDEVWSVSDDGTVARHAGDRSGEEIADLAGRFPDDEDAEGLAYADGTLWVVGAGELVRLDPETGEESGESLRLPGGTEESGYAITAGPEADTVLVVHRPTHRVWLVG